MSNFKRNLYFFNTLYYFFTVNFKGSPSRRLNHYFQSNPSLANAGLVGLRNIGNTVSN